MKQKGLLGEFFLQAETPMTHKHSLLQCPPGTIVFFLFHSSSSSSYFHTHPPAQGPISYNLFRELHLFRSGEMAELCPQQKDTRPWGYFREMSTPLPLLHRSGRITCAQTTSLDMESSLVSVCLSPPAFPQSHRFSLFSLKLSLSLSLC